MADISVHRLSRLPAKMARMPPAAITNWINATDPKAILRLEVNCEASNPMATDSGILWMAAPQDRAGAEFIATAA